METIKVKQLAVLNQFEIKDSGITNPATAEAMRNKIEKLLSRKMIVSKAEYVTEVEVTDPDTNGTITLEVFKHPNGGMFAMDVSFLETFDDDVRPSFPDPFGNDDGNLHVVSVPSTDEME